MDLYKSLTELVFKDRFIFKFRSNTERIHVCRTLQKMGVKFDDMMWKDITSQDGFELYPSLFVTEEKTDLTGAKKNGSYIRTLFDVIDNHRSKLDGYLLNSGQVYKVQKFKTRIC